MNTTFRLGKIAGIPIGISWTWLPIFALFVWSLASGVFPSSNPGLSGGVYFAMAVIAALVFFTSLLLHELGHALQARRDGVQIDGITLWFLGGVARFRSGFPSAGAEFRVAAAGPAVTLVLGLGFLGLAALTHFGAAVDGLLAWLGYINLVLLGFNLVPALPLDGGRIFRSILWRIKGDHFWATRVAAAVGVGLASLMMAAGVVSAFTGGGGIDGVWLVFVGWFILSAARAELQLATFQAALDGLVVSDVMSRHPVVSQAGQTIRDFMAEVPADDHAVAYPVLDGLRPVGILPSPRAATTLISPRGVGDGSALVGDRMVGMTQMPVLTPNESASEALVEMMDASAPSALVLEDGRLAGMVSFRDIAEAIRIGDRRRQRADPDGAAIGSRR